jgi:hypothetical protein
LSYSPAAIAQSVINARDLGLSETTDATPIIRKAIQKCREEKATKLIIPQGTYHFHPETATEKYVAISNHDNGLKRIAFPLSGIQNLTIDGSGASFIFHGYMLPFLIEDASNIKLENFSIDWDKPFHLQARVIEVSHNTNSFKLKISEENEYEIIGEELRFKVFGKSYNLVQNLWFDPISKATVYDVPEYKIDPWNPHNRLSYKAKDLGNNVVEVQHTVAKLPKEGWIFVVKGRTEGNRSRFSPGIHINRSAEITLRNIDIYHAGGMGLIGEKSEDIALKNFNVLLNPNRERIISTTADATHFVNCKGHISFEGCLFENMLDDATNVHGTYLKIADKVDERTLLLKTIHFQQYGFEFAEPGDTLRVVGSKSLKPTQALTVKAVDALNEEYQRIEFKEALVADIAARDYMENLSWNASLTMTNCKVHRNRARGILVKTSGAIKVENCYFSSMMAAIAVGCAGGGGWGESGPVTDVVIRNNRFVNNCTGAREAPIILIAPAIESHKPGFFFNKNILIEENRMETFHPLILRASSLENLTFRQNVIVENKDFSPWATSKASIEVEHGRNVIIEGNNYSGEKDATIQLDKATLSTAKVLENKGFLPQPRVND